MHCHYCHHPFVVSPLPFHNILNCHKHHKATMPRLWSEKKLQGRQRRCWNQMIWTFLFHHADFCVSFSPLKNSNTNLPKKCLVLRGPCRILTLIFSMSTPEPTCCQHFLTVTLCCGPKRRSKIQEDQIAMLIQRRIKGREIDFRIYQKFVPHKSVIFLVCRIADWLAHAAQFQKKSKGSEDATKQWPWLENIKVSR